MEKIGGKVVKVRVIFSGFGTNCVRSEHVHILVYVLFVAHVRCEQDGQKISGKLLTL